MKIIIMLKQNLEASSTLKQYQKKQNLNFDALQLLKGPKKIFLMIMQQSSMTRNLQETMTTKALKLNSKIHIFLSINELQLE